MVYKVYYLLAKNSKVDRRGGLKERGFVPLKREEILEKGLYRGFKVICFFIKHLVKIKLQFIERKT